MMPDRELHKNWVAALRSGEYEQARGCLSMNLTDGRTAYCCLGVLNRISNGLPPHEGKEFHSLYEMLAPKDGGAGSNANDASQVVGILVEMNDKQRKTFPEIADWVEANL
jgi:hypothetical protein